MLENWFKIFYISELLDYGARNIKLLVAAFLILIPLKENVLYGKCFSEDCKSLEEFSKKNKRNKFLLDNQIIQKLDFTDKELFDNKSIISHQFLDKESIKLDQILANLLVSNQIVESDKSDKINYQIEADSQYIKGQFFVAEGNVILDLPNGTLTADKISYDKKNKLFKAENKLIFKSGKQFFKADYLEYDFIKNYGYINNIFGILDYRSINKDLKLYGKNLDNKVCLTENLDLNELPSEIELLGSNNERYKNSLGLNKIKLDFSKITNWRFKSKRIELKENKWEAESIDFTNDPFNKPQLIIRSKNFLGEIIDNETKLTSKSTTLNFDDKFSIPIIGKRTLSSSDSANLRWGVGYEAKQKDGFYLLRNFDPIEINKYFSLDLQPYFLLQRALKGNSDSFREKNSSVLSDNSKKDINGYDYFGLNTKLKGGINRWQININADTKTFNTDNFYDAFSADVNVFKNIYSFKRDNQNICNNSSLVKKSEKHSIDLGFYSLFDKDDIYSSYGTKLLSNYKSKNENLNKDYSLVLDIGNFQGKSLKNKYELKSLNRYGFTSKLSHIYKIFEFNKEKESYTKDYKNSPKIIDNGLFINGKIGAGLFEYSNGTSQSLFSLTFGPSFTYGDLKKNFFDFTNISIFPELISKSGESPYAFDDFNSDSRIRFDIKQQLYGPLIIGFSSNYNINTNSSNYGKFENKRFSLELSRRSYSLGLSYLEDDESIFFGFNIFNFGDHKFKKNF